MSSDNLLEYRVTELENWKKEFVPEYYKTEKDTADSFSKLMSDFRLLAYKFASLITAIVIVIQGVAWFITNEDKVNKYTKTEKDNYYNKIVSNSDVTRDLYKYIELQNKKIQELERNLK